MKNYSISLFSMVMRLNEIVQEAGDLENIQTYDYETYPEKYEFSTENGLKVNVNFEELSDSEVENIDISKNLGFIPKYGQVVNVAYTVNGIDTQAKKTNYTTLIRILKTVSDIIVDYANKNEQVIGILIIPANKREEDYLKKSDPQKSTTYQTIVVKNISKLPGKWSFMRTKYMNLETIVLFKKNK